MNKNKRKTIKKKNPKKHKKTPSHSPQKTGTVHATFKNTWSDSSSGVPMVTFS